MPQTKAKLVQPQPAVKAPQSTSPTQQARERIQADLGRCFEQFLADAWPEETRFMVDVLTDWESNRTGGARQPEEFEVPIYSACQLNLNSKALIEVPFAHREKVNAFVASLAVGDCIASLERA